MNRIHTTVFLLITLTVPASAQGLKSGRHFMDSSDQRVSRYNSMGLCVVQRKILFMSILEGKDTVYYPHCHPGLYLSKYKMISFDPDYRGYMNIADGKDTLPIPYRFYNPEEYRDIVRGDCKRHFSGEYRSIDSGISDAQLDTFFMYRHIYVSLEGLADKEGNLIQPPVFEKIYHVGDANQPLIYPFVFRDKVGFMDSTGKIIINPVYDNVIERFSDNRDWYHSEDDGVESYHFFGNRCEVVYRGKLGVIDLRGNIIVPFMFKHITYEQKWDKGISRIQAIIATSPDDRVWRYDLNGNIIPQ